MDAAQGVPHASVMQVPVDVNGEKVSSKELAGGARFNAGEVDPASRELFEQVKQSTGAILR